MTGTAELLARIEGAEEKRRREFEGRWREYYRIFRFQAEQAREGSNIFTPYTFMQCAVIQARVAAALFANRPYVTALPREDADIEQARLMQVLLDWQLSDRVQIKRVIGAEVLQSMVVYGTGISYTGWKLKTRRLLRPVLEEQPLRDAAGLPLLDERGQAIGMPRRQVREVTEAVYDDPLVQCIDLFDFYVDPFAVDIADARYCGHSEYQTRAQLQELVDSGHYRIDFKRLEPLGDIEKAAHKKQGLAAGEDEMGAGPGALYLVHHYWEEGRHAVIINRKVVALDEPNPFWHGMKPYDKCCYQTLAGEFYGIGVPEMCRQLQDELNTNRNQRIDYNSMALRRMWKVRRGSGITQADLKWRQNGVIEISDMNDVAEINVQQLPAASFANEESIKKDMRDVTGCHDIVMGLSDFRETATSTMTKDNNAALRFRDVVEAVERDLLAPIARKCVALNQQYLSAERAVRVVGEERAEQLVRIDPLALNGSYDIVYSGSAVDAMANRELQRERVLQAYALLAGDPLYTLDTEARLRLMRKVLEVLEVRGVEELLPRVLEGE